MVPTFGGNYWNGLWRIIGTLLGALCGIIVNVAVKENAIGNVFIAFLLSLLFFHVKYNTKYQRMFVALMTYLVVVVNSIHPARPSENSVYQIAYKRAASVLFGVIIALLVSRTMWPYLARRELRLGDYNLT
jgi:uncharacterized membrane protein YccC